MGTPPPGASLAGRIAFARGMDLFVMDPDGSASAQLASTRFTVGSPRAFWWSPDGSRIAFQAPGPAGSPAIFTIGSDGADPRMVTEIDMGTAVELSWSPDGSHLAFSYWPAGVTGDAARPAIHVVNADGDERRQLTDGMSEDFQPAWSPDGTQIAFTSARDGNREIYLMSADGTGQRRLTDDPAEDSGPTWSPDGDQVLFLSNRDAPAGSEVYAPEIYVINADGTGEQNLTNHPAHDSSPAWSPSGDRIAFVSSRDEASNGDIYVMGNDGSGVQRLTDYPCLDTAPSWSPDGRSLAFTRWFHDPPYDEGTADIFVVGADSTGETRLTDSPEWDWLPAWSPR